MYPYCKLHIALFSILCLQLKMDLFPFSRPSLKSPLQLNNNFNSFFPVHTGSCLQCYKCSGDLTQCNRDAGIETCTAGSRCASLVLNSADSMHFMFGCATPLDCVAANSVCTEITKDKSQITCNATCCDEDSCVTPYSKGGFQIQ